MWKEKQGGAASEMQRPEEVDGKAGTKCGQMDRAQTGVDGMDQGEHWL